MQNAKQAAIYHFTNKSEKRPIYYQKTLARLTDFAASYGYKNPDIYCDKDLVRGKQTEYDRLLDNAGQYDAVIVKDLYHLSRTTVKAFKMIRRFQEQGAKVLTLDNGIFVPENPPLEKHLRAVSYVHKLDRLVERDEAIRVQQQIFQLYIEEKTAWTLEAQYSDTSVHQNKGEHDGLTQLAANRGSYDILIVASVGEIHWRAEEFEHLWDEIRLPIYSLKYGYYPYRKFEV